MKEQLKKRGVVAIVVLALVGAVVAAYSAAPSGASQYSVTPKQFRALSKKVAKLTHRVNVLSSVVSCLGGGAGITLNGNPAAGSGYVATKDGGATYFLATALNATASGQTPSFYAATVRSACVTSSRATFRLNRTPSRRTAPLRMP